MDKWPDRIIMRVLRTKGGRLKKSKREGEQQSEGCNIKGSQFKFLALKMEEGDHKQGMQRPLKTIKGQQNSFWTAAPLDTKMLAQGDAPQAPICHNRKITNVF